MEQAPSQPAAFLWQADLQSRDVQPGTRSTHAFLWQFDLLSEKQWLDQRSPKLYVWQVDLQSGPKCF